MIIFEIAVLVHCSFVNHMAYYILHEFCRDRRAGLYVIGPLSCNGLLT